MTSRVIEVFEHVANPLEVARQEYELAKRHFIEVVKHRDATDRDHQQRFRDAAERQAMARDRFVRMLVEW